MIVFNATSIMGAIKAAIITIVAVVILATMATITIIVTITIRVTIVGIIKREDF